MRITSSMVYRNYITGLNKTLGKETEWQEKIAANKGILKPSDDPIKVIRSLRFNTNLSMNEQYKQNVSDALSWMQTSDGIVNDVGQIMIRAKELTVRSIDINPDIAYEAAASELDDLISAAVDAGNTKIGDRYIFAGQQDKVQPFARQINGSDDKVLYNGDNNYISIKIMPGMVDSKQDSINLTGQDVFGKDNAVFQHLIEIKQHMLSHDNKWLSETGLGYLEADHDSLLKARTNLGGRMAMYEMSQNMLAEETTTITANVDNNEGIDVARSIIDLKQSDFVYRSALAVGARIMQTSLVDFLK